MIETTSSVDRLLGLLSQTMGDLSQAATHFEDALAFCRKAGYRPELAWTCCDYADMLRQRDAQGYRAKAITLLDEALAMVADVGEVENPSRRYLLDIARSANDASALVREAWSNYSSPVDYGVNGLDLPKVVSLLDAGMPTRIYYVSYRNNAFDTHVFQNDLHRRLLTYTSDAVSAFMQDLERIGRADDVALMIFSEFGRRVPENVSLGTDHGAANAMFVVGKTVKGGHYGELPSLTQLTEGDNLPHTTDFRRVYRTMIKEWLGHGDTAELLNGDFESFDLFT